MKKAKKSPKTKPARVPRQRQSKTNGLPAASHSLDQNLPSHATTQSLRQAQMVQRQQVQGNTAVIQRQNEPAAETNQTTSVNLGNVDLRYLLEYYVPITNPTGMNLSARRLIERINTAGTEAEELRGELSYLHYAEESSASDLAAVQGARAAIGRASRGRRGVYMQEMVANYVDSSNAIREHIPRVTASQSQIRAKVANLRRVIANGRILQAERQERTAQANVADIQARIARAKELAKGLIGPVSNLLQGKWQEAGIDLAKFIGGEIISAAVDSAYASELAQAQAELQQIRTQIDQFQDESQAAALETATEELRAARAEGEAAQNALMRVVMVAERAHMNLYEALEGIGESGAASALDARATTMEAAARARRKLNSYQQLVNRIKEQSSGLKNLNAGLADMMLAPGGTHFVPNENHRNAIYFAATHNVEELERIKQYAENELITIASAQGYVEGESYLQNYNQIPQTLNEGVANR
ncbi:MAG: hypothetical protein Kow0080_26490 [Candidatus Promineifilaceae bacterium]